MVMQKSMFFITLIFSCFAMYIEGCESIHWDDILQEMSNNDVFEHKYLYTSESCMKGFNHEETVFQKGKIKNRIYINPECISFTNNKIYLIAGDCYIPIESINCDSKGYYFCTNNWLNWKCCKCDRLNSYEWNTCSRCSHYRC